MCHCFFVGIFRFSSRLIILRNSAFFSQLGRVTEYAEYFQFNYCHFEVAILLKPPWGGCERVPIVRMEWNFEEWLNKTGKERFHGKKERKKKQHRISPLVVTFEFFFSEILCPLSCLIILWNLVLFLPLNRTTEYNTKYYCQFNYGHLDVVILEEYVERDVIARMESNFV